MYSSLNVANLKTIEVAVHATRKVLTAKLALGSGFKGGSVRWSLTCDHILSSEAGPKRLFSRISCQSFGKLPEL